MIARERETTLGEGYKVLVTDTVGRPELDWPGWRVVSVAELLASAIGRMAEGKRIWLTGEVN